MLSKAEAFLVPSLLDTQKITQDHSCPILRCNSSATIKATVYELNIDEGSIGIYCGNCFLVVLVLVRKPKSQREKREREGDADKDTVLVDLHTCF